MSSTPLFDSIARRAEQPASPRAVPLSPQPTPAQPSGAAIPDAARIVHRPVPTSPLSGAVAAHDAALVPAALVAAIDEIPARIGGALAAEHVVGAEQLVLVEAVADALTRAVVDAVVHELDRIARDGVVRA